MKSKTGALALPSVKVVKFNDVMGSIKALPRLSTAMVGGNGEPVWINPFKTYKIQNCTVQLPGRLGPHVEEYVQVPEQWVPPRQCT